MREKRNVVRANAYHLHLHVTTERVLNKFLPCQKRFQHVLLATYFVPYVLYLYVRILTAS